MQVNSNGVISLQNRFPDHFRRPFPTVLRENEAILCPFWDDINPSLGGDIYHSNFEQHQNALSKASQLIQTTLGHAFHPTIVFTATWDHVPSFGGSVAVSLI